MQTGIRFVAALAVLATATPAFAQDQRLTPAGRNQFQPDAPAETSAPAGSQTPKALLGQGYEIKAFSIIPRAIVVGGGSTVDTDAVIIIMQKGDSLANCYVTFTGFIDGSYYSGSSQICRVLE